MKKFASMAIPALMILLIQEPLVRAAFVPAPQPADPNTARAIYDRRTGELWFSVGANIYIVGVETTVPLTLGLNPCIGPHPAVKYDSEGLAYVHPNQDSLPVGIWSQGFIAPAGLPVTPAPSLSSVLATRYTHLAITPHLWTSSASPSRRTWHFWRPLWSALFIAV